MVPTPRQQEFLALTDDEALYGGAAGGGKSEALLRWLAEGADVPSYTGIIFRRTYPQLAKSNEGLIAKSFRMYQPMGGTWNGSEKQWRFPSGAMIELGHLPYETSIYDYQGPSYHRIAWDELTQFSSNQYLYLKSRIRNAPGFPITTGMRAASNPGGLGHQWVKKRFVSTQALRSLAGLKTRDPSPAGVVFRHAIDTSEGAVSVAFCPARLADNPYIDFDRYAKNLAAHDPVTRERLLNGDWSITEDAPIRGHWFRYYEVVGDIIRPLDADAKQTSSMDSRRCNRFATIDTAGTSRDKADEARGKAAAWSVVAVWDYDRRSDLLFLRHVWRQRAAWGELKTTVPEVLRSWNVRRVRVENAHVGPPLADELKGFDVKMVGPMLPGMTEGHRGAKLERAIASGLLGRCEAGKLLLPADANDWCADYEDELTSWSGGPDEVCDQIDASSYGAWECKQSMATWGGTIPAK